MTEPIKVCPFCGGAAEQGGYISSWYIRCKADDCWASQHGSLYLDEADAIAAWNRRPQPQNAPAVAELARTIIKQALHDPANVMMLGEIKPLADAYLSNGTA